jgi:RNA polymerase sigma-70 factor, ECF subfamily
MRERVAAGGQGAALLLLYDSALPQVYGYLVARCDSRLVAEDLTAETFMAAVDAVRRAVAPPVSVGWLVGIARHKLADHWRRQAREQRTLRAAAADPSVDPQVEDPWEEQLDAMRAREVLHRLGPQHQAVLTLRYLDDQPVGEVARLMDRTVHATEALLVRARTAFRRAYAETDSGKEDGE